MKSLLFPILSIIAAAGLYFFFISPQLEEINELTLKDQKFTQSLSDVREIQGIIGRLDSNYAGISRDDLVRLERFLPRQADVARIARDINTLLLRGQVEIVDIDIKQFRARTGADQENPLREYEGKLDFFANYPDFKDFLSAYEKSIQVARIDSIEFAPPTRESEDSLGLGLSSYKMNVTYFSFDNTE